MANYNTLKTAIDANIKQNGVQAITGNILNGILNAMVNALGAGYQFMGVAEPTTDPGTPDPKVFYFALEEGAYTHFSSMDVPHGISVLRYEANGTWSLDVLFDFDDIFSGNNTYSGNNTFNGYTRFGDEVDVYFENMYDLEDGETLREKLASLVTAIATKISKVTGAVEDNLATFDENGNVKDSGVSLANIDEKIDECAKADGISEKLVSGSARGILSPSAIEELFLYQRTANGAGGTGAAIIQSIKGNSIMWNQLNRDLMQDWASSMPKSTSDNIVSFRSNASSDNAVTRDKIGVGHKVYVSLVYKSNKQVSTQNIPLTLPANEQFEKKSAIYTPSNIGLYLYNYSQLAAGEWVLQIKSCIFIDLTLIFGAGNEPSTAAEFEAMFPLPYYAYNPGAILNNAATGMVTKDADDNLLDTLDLPITTATGKLNGEGESVVISPNGLAGVGTSFDEAIVEKGMWTKTEKVMSDEIDLGDLVWTKETNDGVVTFKTTLPDAKYASSVNAKANMLCSKYVVETYNNVYNGTTDKAIAINDWTTRILRVYDSTYSGGDAAAFRTAMEGQSIIYELATPEEYILDTPVPVVARVDENGTQTMLPQGVDESGTPMTAPFKASIQYPVKLGIAPIGQQSLVNLLEKMKSAGKIASYTMVWDAATGVYDFTIS